VKYFILLLRFVSLPVLAFVCGAASAAVTCEQLGQIAMSTERLRDQGYSLPEIATEADRLEATKKFSADEMFNIRKVINDAFLRVRTSNETLVECIANSKK
jgi:hypothetical protein